MKPSSRDGIVYWVRGTGYGIRFSGFKSLPTCVNTVLSVPNVSANASVVYGKYILKTLFCISYSSIISVYFTMLPPDKLFS